MDRIVQRLPPFEKKQDEQEQVFTVKSEVI